MTDTSAQRISVIIPTRGRPDLLRRTLARLAPGAQTLARDHYEIIVSDDAIPPSAATALGAEFGGVRFVPGPGRGPAANRNAGARAARFPWFAFTDDDTEPRGDWLAALVAAIRPGVEVYEGRTTCDGGFGSPLYHAPVNETGGRLWSCNFMVSAARLAAVGGFDEGFRFPHMEDQDLRVRLERAGAVRVFVPGAVVNHPPRRQPDGARLGAYREAEVRFHVKHFGRPERRSALLARVVRYRLGVIRDTPKSLDTVAALWSLAREAVHVVNHAGKWERAAAAEFGVAGTASR
ncbi:MAG: glycosyltransferase [Gemmatimonadota bacterium]|nr:glycosyltransferase [Gemmatimonadota bacterium]